MGRYSGKKCRLISMFILTAMYFLVEIVVGYVTNSMALVADSFHMLSDVAALVVAYLSVKMSPKKWTKNTFGWARAEVLGALVNAVFLVALCFSILVEACKRFIEMEEIHEPELIVVVGGVGLLVNVIGLLLFHDYYKRRRCPVPQRTKTAVTPEVTEQMHERRTGKALYEDASVSQKELLESSVVETGSKGSQQSSFYTYHDHAVMKSCRNALLSSPVNPCKHGHSHSGLSRSHTRLGHLVGTDDINENDQNFKPPPPPAIHEKKKVSHGHSHHFDDGAQMNMRGVFLHVLADALGSVIVVVSALIVWLTDWPGRYYIDPALSLILIVLILRSVWPLLQESALILLQTVPTHIQVDAIQRRLLDKVDGVLAVHEFHVWQLAGDRIIASAHIRCRNLSEYMKLAEKVKEFFHNEGIHSTTIQPEFLEINELPEDSQVPLNATTDADCVLDCPKTDQPCVLNTCCGPSKQGRDSPSPGDTPYLCRQRCGSAASFSRIQALQSDMESGHLLSASANADTREPSPKLSPKMNNKGSRV